MTQKLQALSAASNVIAMDLAMPMLHQAQQQSSVWQYLQADAEYLPLKTASVDVIFSSLALQWLPEPTHVLAEIKRVLKQSGHAYIATLADGSLTELKQAWHQVDQYQHVNQFHTVKQWQQAADQMGMKIQTQLVTEQLHYASVLELARDLKGIGAHNLNGQRAKGLTGKGQFQKMAAAYENFRDTQSNLPATYQVIYLRCSH